MAYPVDQGRPESMSKQMARPAERERERVKEQASRFQQMTLSTDAQPSTTGEEQSAEGCSGEARRTFSNHLSHLEVARTSNEANWGVNLGPGGEGGPYGTDHKLQTHTIAPLLSTKSETIVADKIEQLELSQLNSPQLRELVKRLKYLYKIDSPPKDDNLTNRNVLHPYAAFKVAERWEELQGCSRWDGLLDPMDAVLRAEILRYGEFAQAAYDGFDRDKSSKYCGSCKYEKEYLLERCGLENRGYEVTQYLYATAELDVPHFFTKSFLDDKWSKDSNWMGYVAVCTSPQEIARLGRRDIVVAWRGTITKFEWIKDVQDWLVPAGFDPRNGKKDVMVESGFLSVYKSSNAKSRYNKKSVREQVLGAVKELVEKYKHEKDTRLSITITGHSLGSAIAMLCGYDIAESKLNRLFGQSPSVPNAWHSRKADWEANLPDSGSQSGSGSKSTSTSATNLDSSVVPALNSSLNSASRTSSSSRSSSNRGSGRAAVGGLEKAAVKSFPSDRIPITVYSFAGPRVGNLAFKERMEELGVAVLRVVNKHDLVTKVPGRILPKVMAAVHHLISIVPSYKHVGVKLKIDNTASNFLQDPENPLHAHCLEGYLHVVDGFHGKKMPFKPTIRDYALVNKGGDFLKRELCIPAAWWQEAYKGLVRDKDGHWTLPRRGEEIWPSTPAEERPPEVEKHEQFEEFWRSVSIAYERSTSRSDSYVSLAALQGAAERNCALDGAVNSAFGK